MADVKTIESPESPGRLDRLVRPSWLDSLRKRDPVSAQMSDEAIWFVLGFRVGQFLRRELSCREAQEFCEHSATFLNGASDGVIGDSCRVLRQLPVGCTDDNLKIVVLPGWCEDLAMRIAAAIAQNFGYAIQDPHDL